ncbi:MAG: hypothetical protein R3C01_08585 [Planctomycetaceae bacterium]
MRIIRTLAHARAGLIGNPSDGYFGKTVSVIVSPFAARITLYDWPTLEIVWSQEDQSRFDNVRELVQDVKVHGYYGGVRLLKAAIKRFVEYCDLTGAPVHEKTFSIRYETNIPRNVGLAGSSAIIVATLRALMEFYEVTIPIDILPSLALDIEKKELGISAGLQDRVIQVFGGAVAMDFSKENARVDSALGLTYGVYERLDTKRLPPLYIAYSAEAGEPTYVVHNPLRARYEAGDKVVVEAMQQFARLAEEFRGALTAGDVDEMHRLVNANFDLRTTICNINRDHGAMIAAARSVGASAKFAGSGGAIIGIYRDQSMLQSLTQALKKLGCTTIPLSFDV